MEWKRGTLRSLLKLNKEKLIFLFCSGLLLFVLALPGEKTVGSETVEIATVNKKEDTEKSQEEELEQRVQHILQGVEGVGEADVMVSLSS